MKIHFPPSLSFSQPTTAFFPVNFDGIVVGSVMIFNKRLLSSISARQEKVYFCVFHSLPGEEKYEEIKYYAK